MKHRRMGERMKTIRVLGWALLSLGVPAPLAAQTTLELADEVRAAEEAFAQTMADRDLELFASYISTEAVFVGREVLRGVEAVKAGWSPYFEGPRAPFGWAPEDVQVLESGTLALSSGPVFDPEGNRIGTFNSVWRYEEDGRWRVVFDKGCP